MDRDAGLSIAYVNYGFQSGVTERVIRALGSRGHRVASLDAVGPVEHRRKGSRRLRIDGQVLYNLAAAFAKFGRQAAHYRWNTTFAFDAHSRHAGELLAALPAQPDVVLQAGALFAPGLPPPCRYVLLLDNTRQLAMERPPEPSVGLGAPPDYGPGWRRREEAVYRGAWSIGTFSGRVRRSLERDYGVMPGRTHVVGAGANVFPEVVERCHDGETILFVGTRWELKGGPVLARAFERIRRTRPRARLVVIGPSRRPALPDGAEYLGYVPASELPAHFARATVFALPTLREAFGIAFLDAMACAVPCIGTAVEAVPEIIEHERTGLLVPPGDDAALAASIERVLDDPALGRRMGDLGRLQVEASYTWEHVAARLERLLAPPALPLLPRETSVPVLPAAAANEVVQQPVAPSAPAAAIAPPR